MQTEYRKEYSHNLNRDMEYKIYGHAGKPVLVFAPQNGHFYDFEDFGMVDTIAPWIENGEIQLFCVDSVDAESWSDEYRDPHERGEICEAFYRYIADEFYPRMIELNMGYNNDGVYRKPMTTGVSMGAAHAGNFFFRRPDLFDSVLSLSGVFNAAFFFHGYMDDNVYKNSPEDFIRNMPADHPWLDMYRHSKMIFCVGQGAWEDEMKNSMRSLEAILRSKGVNNAWFDWWGYDVNHDWPWWKKQIVYFLPKLLE